MEYEKSWFSRERQFRYFCNIFIVHTCKFFNILFIENKFLQM